MKKILTLLLLISMSALAVPDISFLNAGIDKMLFEGSEIEKVRFNSKTIFDSTGGDEDIIVEYNAASDFLILTNNGAIVVTGYVGVATSMNIPPTINGFPVASIQSNAFKNRTTIKSAYIPGSVLSVGDYAFLNNASYLTNVYLGTGVKDIGLEAFNNCNRMKILRIPNTITNFGQSAFKECQDITSFTMPSEVLMIRSNMFFHCVSLTNFNFGNVKKIQYQAFYDAIKLCTITIPSSVTNLEYRSFVYSDVTNIIFLGADTVIREQSFADCDKLKGITLPESLLTLYDNVFYNCDSLKSITIPASVNMIRQYAFSSCSGLYGVYFKGNCPPYDPYGGWFDGCTNINYRLEAATGWPVVPNNYLGRPTAIWNNYPNIP